MLINFAFLTALYGYTIFFLGILGKLTRNNLFWLTCFLILFLALVLFRYLKKVRKLGRKEQFLLFLFLVCVLTNFLGVLGPELAFDALWYHLTLPKLYLQEGKIFFIPGGLFYYSAAPQLLEMIYVGFLSVLGYFGPKFVHFCFGLGSAFVIYKLCRRFLSAELSWVGALIFYSQLTVGWLSTTAYNDLALVFFNNLGLLVFLEWQEKQGKKQNWQEKIILIESGLLFGLAASVKLIGIHSFFALIAFFLLKRNFLGKLFIFSSAFLVPLLPWFVFTYLNTGNPFYPYLTSWFLKSQTGGMTLTGWLLTRHPLNFLKAIGQTVFTSGDILTPVILIGLPLFLMKSKTNLILKGDFFYVYLVAYLLLWFLTPLNYNRFLLPILPVFIFILLRRLQDYPKIISRVFLLSVFLITILNAGSRLMVNKKYLPLIMGQQSEAEFMKKNLNFEAGNFYDVDGFFKNYLKPEKKVLVLGIHNLFYLDFAFKEISMVQKGERFEYLLVGKDKNREKFKKYPLVYQNELTGVALYKVNVSF